MKKLQYMQQLETDNKTLNLRVAELEALVKEYQVLQGVQPVKLEKCASTSVNGTVTEPIVYQVQQRLCVGVCG